MAFLRIKSGNSVGSEFELLDGSTQLGRHPSCELIVQDSAVSRRHAKIESEGGDCFITDLQSRNGTQLNGVDVIKRQKLKHGDEIQICDTIFSFHAYRNKPSDLVDFVDDGGASASSIRKKVDLDSSYRKSDHSITLSKLRTMIDITRALSQTLSLDDVIPKVLDSLFKIFPQGDRAFIVLCDEEGELGNHWVKDRRNRETKLMVSRTIIKEAIRSKEAFLSEDAFTDQRFDLTKSIAGFSIRSVMCAPMIDNDGKAIGCLQIDTLDSSQHFDQDELDLLATVAMQAGISVQNAQMHEQALNQRAMDRDLELAREVQLGLLPKDHLQVEGYEFYDYYEAANKVGGDFYDYIDLKNGRFCTIVADVAGHGIASALLMAKFSAEVRFALASTESASMAVRQINNSIIQLGLKRFITMILAIVNTEKNTITVVNAGHMDPIIHEGSGVREISREIAGLPIGIMEDFEYEEMECTIEPQTTILLYTDGVNESMDRDGNQFGHDRVIETVRTTENSARQVGERLISEVKKFEDTSVDNDDTCVVCISRL
ncbi:SpoIIE family protein phosphatase [Pirellulaceae bacterium]|jgi:serine phosphatase RsbU (regulator of sigma subunit)/pSer/pThr/pTyr-binding forkhead associated (FHA) protein|nr:SpoIIE family protein phosphatase [Pirellulaceae bacterium]